MSAILRLFALVALALTLAAGAAGAEEHIQSWHADIAVSPQGLLKVTETIRVRAEGLNIRRGIFRDFPLYTQEENGRRHKVEFTPLAVERDGGPENWFTESISGGIRIYAGREDVSLAPGLHTYRITYETERQIRYLQDHDELYWNVTGNGWQFRMADVSATITLPPGANVLDTAVFTGALGEVGQDARAVARGEKVSFTTTRPLSPGEGLTIVVGLPKGVIAPPSAEETRRWWLRDHADLLIGFGGLFAVLAYYLRAWLAVGRDPPAGVMVPRWDAPEGLSPALVNYIDNKGFSGGGWTALSASALDLAVKGHVVLEDLKKSITIRRVAKPGKVENLPAGQVAILQAVEADGGTLTLDSAHGETVLKLGETFRNAIEKEHRGRYYHSNALYIAGGLALSLAVFVCLLAFGGLEAESVALILVPVVLAFFIGLIAVKAGRGLRRGRPLAARIASVVALGFIGFVSVAVMGAFGAALLAEADPRTLVTLACGGGIALVNALFFFLMGAPTPLGRKLMDGIEGLRTYLTLAEKDRMNMAGAPQMSPAHFERLLPYAVALGVEKPWTRAFETWLASAAAGAGAASYQPGWYSGDHGAFSGRIGGLSSSLSSTIASTLPAPPSSSGSGFGGGGSSGGGGGGGGGGGW